MGSPSVKRGVRTLQFGSTIRNLCTLLSTEIWDFDPGCRLTELSSCSSATQPCRLNFFSAADLNFPEVVAMGYVSLASK